MPGVFLYEFVTGGGWWSVDSCRAPEGSLLQEAIAMIQALAEDFACLPGIEVTVLWDARLANELAPPGTVYRVERSDHEHLLFSRLAQRADYVLLIAPEFDGHLARRVDWAEAFDCRMLSPGSEFVRLASDKHRTAETLLDAGVPAPRGVLHSRGASLPGWLRWPAVIKPNDGAGSMDIRLVESPSDLDRLGAFDRAMRVEEFCSGTAASIAVLCGPKEQRILPAGKQFLSNRGDFRYFGGELPLNVQWQSRAARLARRALDAFPKATGYIGIDLVLGEASDGSEDFVIEMNPRLTTSYVGLRRLGQQNLAGAMLAIARGETVELTFDSKTVRFEMEP